MMPNLLLEDFEAETALPAPSPKMRSDDPGIDPSEAESVRMKAYEEGYQAGWDDAARAQSEAEQRMNVEFTRSLKEISLTYHEARSHVIQSMEPLLTTILETVLPEISTEVLANTVQQRLSSHIADAADRPVEIIVGPGGSGPLSEAIDNFAQGAIQIVEEPSLTDSQAYLRVGKSEHKVDVAAAVDALRDSMSAMFKLNKKALANE